MKKYQVNEVAQIAGVSKRTLHYYDEIGLLPPQLKSGSQYRYYGESELLRLQQILFYKKLRFPLQVIKDLLDDPDYDMIGVLNKQKKSLKKQISQMKTLIQNIEQTIYKIQNNSVMKNPHELYRGFSEENAKKWRSEAIAKYGEKTVKKSEDTLMAMGKTDFEKLSKQQKELAKKLFDIKGENPKSEKVQNLIDRHYHLIRKFWGTDGQPDSQAEAYKGLGKLYLEDERYTAMEGRPQPDFAEFLCAAMGHFADQL